MGGTYTLLLELDTPARITFGAAGDRHLDAGWYAYTGSALGNGGFARVDRHRRVAVGDRDVRHWHVDSLLGHDLVRLDSDVRSPGVEAECPIATRIASVADPVSGIGATDCDCDSHLAFARSPSVLRESVRQAHEQTRG